MPTLECLPVIGYRGWSPSRAPLRGICYRGSGCTDAAKIVYHAVYLWEMESHECHMNCILDYLSRLIIVFLSAADSPREKLLRHLCSCHPFNALVYIHLINKLLMHQQNMRSSWNLTVYRSTHLCHLKSACAFLMLRYNTYCIRSMLLWCCIVRIALAVVLPHAHSLEPTTPVG